MGNLESAEGGPGEPPSVSLLLPPGKMPMPEPCELEERFALVLVRAEPSPFPLPPPPRVPTSRVGFFCGSWSRPLLSQGRRQTPASSVRQGASEQPVAERGQRVGDLRGTLQPLGTPEEEKGEREGDPSSGPPQDPDFSLLPFPLLTSPGFSSFSPVGEFPFRRLLMGLACSSA